MRVAVDTNRYVDLAKGIPEAAQRVAHAEQIFLPFIVIGELRYGFIHGSKKDENERELAGFLRAERVSVLYADDMTTHHYALLALQLRKQGTPIPTNDIWVAALVVQHNLRLFARDRHFDAFPQLPRL